MPDIMIDDRRCINEIYAASAAALAAGDLETLARFYTHDAMQFPPDAPPLLGWLQIRASLEDELAGITFLPSIEVKEIVVQGDLACAWGRFHATIASQDGGHQATTSSSFLDVLLRHSDGSWKIARSAWSNHEL